MLFRVLSCLIIALLFALPASAADEMLKSKVIPLNGKLIQSDDATQIGTNFQTLQNLRPTDSHVKGVGGMTKVNSTVLSAYPYIKNAFHFNKIQPTESHVLLHAYDATGTTAVLIESEASVPAGGDFVEATPVVSLTSYADGFFATVPNDNVVFANGNEQYIYGGDESEIASFFTSSSAVTYTVTNSNDYSDILNNTRTETDQIATLSVSGGNDAYTVLLLHMDGANNGTTFTDSSASLHAVAANGAAKTITSQLVFGTASSWQNAPGDYLSSADSDDWSFGTGNFTIDTWVKFTNIAAEQYIISQYQDANNFWSVYKTSHVAGDILYIRFTIGGVSKAYYTSAAGWPGIVQDTWYHLAIVRNGTALNAYIGGVNIPLSVTTAIGSSDLGNVAGSLYLGYDGHTPGSELNGDLDELRISKGVARWTGDFSSSLPTQAYGNASNTFLVGSRKQLKGVKIYVYSGNTVASTMTVKEWQGTTWATLAVTDNTDTGATLAVTGTINWTASGAAKQRYINGVSLYWYQFSFDAGQASIYYVTTNAAAQSITNTWSGEESLAIKTLKYNGTTYIDYSIEVADDSQSTYADLSSLAVAHFLVVGFTQPQQGLDITFVAGSENTTAATTMTAKYWKGDNWEDVVALSDGTLTTTTSMSKGGTVIWQGKETGEFVTTISNEVPLYYYKVSFAGILDADVKVSEIRGIPFPKAIPPYTFPTMYQNRTVLLSDKNGKKNKLLYSAEAMESTFNGEDSGELYVGDESELTAACTLSLVLTSALEQLIITKKNQTYRLFGKDPSVWELQLISGTVGCVAPKTMKTVSLPLDSVSNYIGRHIAIWQGADGIYVTDGRTPSPIHGDIKNLFDKRSSASINTAKIADSVGFIDHENLEYHWLFASGSSATLDKEYVFDLRRWKWFEIDRGTGKRLQCGFKVTDTYGNNYTYGAINAGYIERLEYGNSFDGGNIVHTFQLGDFALADNPLYETRAQYVNLSMVAKTTTANSVLYTHYVDTETSGTSFTMSPVSSGKRVANVVANINSKIGVFHSPKFVMTTNNETIGFEPLYMGFFYKVEREHLR